MIRMALFLTCAALAAQPPLPRGAQPVNLGAVGAGEGPAWHPTNGLHFSGGGRITRRDLKGEIHVFRSPSGGSNGLLFDPTGRLIVCEAGNRRVTRTEVNGEITVLADNFEGKRFNSPNDLTMDSKGRIYFTDPRYGNRDTMEMGEGVYRIDSPGKVARIIAQEVERPNGILVSPKDDWLYVADNNNNIEGGARKLRRFRLRPDGGIDPATRKSIFDWKNGRGPDGFKMDTKGRLYVAAGRSASKLPFESDAFKGGIYVLSPEGKQLAFAPVPVDEVTNCAFGGPDLKTLFITAGGTLWSLPVTTPGRILFTGR